MKTMNLSTSAFVRSVTLMMVASAGVANAALSGPSDDTFAGLPTNITIGATIRDFRASTEVGGHPDFERWTGGTRVGLVNAQLDADHKPVLLSSFGSDIKGEYKNAAGHNIMPSSMASDLGDMPGTLLTATEKRIESTESFAQWYRDVPGMNVSKQIQITLTRAAGTNRYVFDSAVDEPWKSIGGFFAADGDGYGNYLTFGHNFHFTTELASEFVYEKGKGHVFTFTGDDDVWVFIDGQMVIDLGGVHPKREQTVELDRLNFLEDGKTYSFHIFHAERHTVQSNFRMETTLRLKPIAAPPVTGLYD